MSTTLRRSFELAFYDDHVSADLIQLQIGCLALHHGHILHVIVSAFQKDQNQQRQSYPFDFVLHVWGYLLQSLHVGRAS